MNANIIRQDYHVKAYIRQQLVTPKLLYYLVMI